MWVARGDVRIGGRSVGCSVGVGCAGRSLGGGVFSFKVEVCVYQSRSALWAAVRSCIVGSGVCSCLVTASLVCVSCLWLGVRWCWFPS